LLHLPGNRTAEESYRIARTCLTVLASARALARECAEILVENAMSCALANVLASNAFRAGPHAFACARRPPGRRKPAC
jgi:hypothetical protein